MFFILLEDIAQILKDIEAAIDVQYYKTGLMDDKNIMTYSSIFDIPNIGFTTSGDWNRIDNYLVMKETTPLIIEDVPQRAGGIKFSVDQLMNRKSITIKLGGIYEIAENIIVAGRVATVSEEEDSIELFTLF